MAWTNIINSQTWLTSPTALWTIQYEYQRSGTEMQYRFKWKVWLKYSSGYYLNKLSLYLYVDGSVITQTIKEKTSKQEQWTYEGETDWYAYTKAKGATTSFYARIYDNSKGEEKEKSSTYSLMVVDPPASTPSTPTATKAIVNSVTSFTDEGNPKVTFTNSSGCKLVPYVNIYDKDKSTQLLSITRTKGTYTSPYTFSLTDDERTNLRKVCKDSNVYNVTVGVVSYDGDTRLGSDSIWTDVTIVNANPTYAASKVTYTSTTPTVSVGNQTVVQNKSTLSVTCGAATGNKEATITKYEVTFNGVPKTITAASGGTVSLGSIATEGTLPLTVKVTDSRSNSTTVSKDITVIPYSKPSVRSNTAIGGAIQCYRCNSGGTPSDDGQYFKLVLSGRWYSLTSGQNVGKLEAKLTSTGYESDWINITGTTLGGGSSNGYQSWTNVNKVVTDIALDAAKTYSVTIRCSDSFYNSSDASTYSEVTYKLTSKHVTLHLGKGGKMAAFGKYAQTENALEIASDWEFIASGNVSGRVIGLGKLPMIPKSGKDFNTCLSIGVYGVDTPSTAVKCANCPIGDRGVLRVFSANGTGRDFDNTEDSAVYLIQEYIAGSTAKIYRRYVSYISGAVNPVWEFSNWYTFQESVTPADYVIENGEQTVAASTDGDGQTRNQYTWYYQKWKSGLVEMHARVQFSEINANAFWNGTVNSYSVKSSSNTNITVNDTAGVYTCYINASNLSYPFTFKFIPMCNVTIEYSSINFWLVTCDKAGTVSTAPKYQVARANSGKGSVWLNYHVRGYI